MSSPAQATSPGAGNKATRVAVDRWLGALAVLVALAAFVIVRIECDEIALHLATGRLADTTGAWPTTNTFSWTYPNYPLYQQYPLFHWVIFRVYQLGGWPGLSLLQALGWTTVFLLFVRWGGPWRRAAGLHLLWILGLWALQRRFMLRPDLGSMLLLAAGLWVAHGYLQGRRWMALLLPAVQLTWVNAHQLFPLFLGIQGLLILHVAVSFWRPTYVAKKQLDGSAWSALWPLLAAFVAATGTIVASPLGSGILRLFSHTAGSLSHHRDHVQELAFVWTQPLEFSLTLLLGVPACLVLLLSIRRRCFHPFEMGLWLMSLILVMATVRGLMFFGPISAAIVSRTLARLPASPAGSPLAIAAGPMRFLRMCALFVTIVVAFTAARFRWITPAVTIGGTQPGLGRTLGDWPDRAMAFLDRSPPPGRMLNMPWSASAIIWFHPEIPVFVDPRFESYPRAFLLDAIASMTEDRVLDRLVKAHQPDWILAQHCRSDVRARLAHLVLQRNWKVVHADPLVAIAVRPGPSRETYLREHPPVDLPLAPPPDPSISWPAVADARAACWAQLRNALDPAEL